MKIWKYQVIEYELKKMTNKEIEYAKSLHKTNSKLLFYLIIICMKLSRVKYEKKSNKRDKMREKSIDEKIIFVDKIISATENIRTYRYFKDIINYIIELRGENNKLYEANIHLVDELNAIKKGEEL